MCDESQNHGFVVVVVDVYVINDSVLSSAKQAHENPGPDGEQLFGVL